jgi:hypothetical protein
LRNRLVPVLVSVLIAAAAAAPATSLAIVRSGTVVQIRATNIEFIAGTTLQRLKDGRSVEMEFTLSLLPGVDGDPFAQLQRHIVLSYDLWEERFAASITDPPVTAVSHLGPRQAEAWCLAQLAFPVNALASRGTGSPFWIRLAYISKDDEEPAADADAGGLTLRGLIDRLSRRGRRTAERDTILAGPFRIDPS